MISDWAITTFEAHPATSRQAIGPFEPVWRLHGRYTRCDKRSGRRAAPRVCVPPTGWSSTNLYINLYHNINVHVTPDYNVTKAVCTRSVRVRSGYSYAPCVKFYITDTVLSRLPCN